MAEQTKERNDRKVRTGTVVSDKMDKTIVVSVETRKAHPLYRKVIKEYSKFYAHDEKNLAKEGDRVHITETRPISKSKRWRLVEVVDKGTA